MHFKLRQFIVSAILILGLAECGVSLPTRVNNESTLAAYVVGVRVYANCDNYDDDFGMYCTDARLVCPRTTPNWAGYARAECATHDRSKFKYWFERLMRVGWFAEWIVITTLLLCMLMIAEYVRGKYLSWDRELRRAIRLYPSGEVSDIRRYFQSAQPFSQLKVLEKKLEVLNVRIMLSRQTLVDLGRRKDAGLATVSDSQRLELLNVYIDECEPHEREERRLVSQQLSLHGKIGRFTERLDAQTKVLDQICDTYSKLRDTEDSILARHYTRELRQLTRRFHHVTDMLMPEPAAHLEA